MEAAANLIFEDDSDDDFDIEGIEGILRRPRIFKTRQHYFEQYDDVDFHTRFRITKGSALLLLELIEHRIEFPSDRNDSISPINQLLLTLRYYATGSQQITMADYCGMSRSTANRIIHRVSEAIALLNRDFIKFPDTSEEIIATQLGFHSIAKFPKVVGALDCTHIKIRSPGGDNAEFFRNRKGNMSINVQVICDSNLKILDLVARWPGSTQDQTIWNGSRRFAFFEAGQYGDAVLVADSGYMNKPFIMMPLENPVRPEELLYNESQIRTRNPIERLFGVWKRRFPVLALGIQMTLQNCLPVISATAVINNLILNENDPLPPNDPELELPMPWEQLIAEGQIREQRADNNQNRGDINSVRRSLICNYFKTLHLRHVRENQNE